MYCPTGQFTQEAWPTEAWYWPTTHAVHTVAPAAEKEPVKQLEQLVSAVAPVAAKKVPAGQLLQIVELVTA